MNETDYDRFTIFCNQANLEYSTFFTGAAWGIILYQNNIEPESDKTDKEFNKRENQLVLYFSKQKKLSSIALDCLKCSDSIKFEPSLEIINNEIIENPSKFGLGFEYLKDNNGRKNE